MAKGQIIRNPSNHFAYNSVIPEKLHWTQLSKPFQQIKIAPSELRKYLVTCLGKIKSDSIMVQVFIIITLEMIKVNQIK